MDNQTPLLEPLNQRETEILEHLAAGLSDKQIAAELFLSWNTIRWYNRRIYSKLGAENRTQAVAYANASGILEKTDAQTRSHSGNPLLPLPTSSFIGRSREITDVTRLLKASRLLTLTGTGGTGKTQLALRVAWDLQEDFADAVYFVDLAPITNPAFVINAIADALDVFEHADEALSDTLKRILSSRTMLLIIDNFEHVITAAPSIAQLQEASPRLSIMVTSREALRLSNEQEYQVPPLSLPPTGTVSAQEVTASEAGSLFVHRVQMVQAHFLLNDENAPAIAQICTQLDGLPLAIELAAARCKLLTPQSLLDRLENRLTMLTSGSRDVPSRQQTLRATIDWSVKLLDADEKVLFRELAVFRNGCSLEAIEAICGNDLSANVLDILESLVNKSLVQQKESVDGELRFFMLETIHEYALDQLESTGEFERIRQRHADYFVAMAEQAEPELRLAQQKRWFHRLETEQENIRAVLQWSLDGSSISNGIRLAGALSWYWYACGYHIEGFRWTQHLLEHLDESPEQYQAKFLIGAAHMMRVRNLNTTKPLLMKALTLSRQLGDTHQIAYALIHLGYSMIGERDALKIAQEGLTLFRQLDHKTGIAHGLTTVGEIARFSGNFDLAQQAYEETLSLCHELDNTRGIAITLLNLTFIAHHQGDYESARDLSHRALFYARETDLEAEMAECLIAVAAAIGVTQQAYLATRLFGAAESAIERLGAFFDAPDRPEINRMIASVRAQIDATSFEIAWNEGKQMTLEEAVQCALDESQV